MCGNYKIALYTVLLSAVDGEILLLPVRVRLVETARSWLRTLLYIHVRRITCKAITFVNVLHVGFIVIHICSGIIRFTDLYFMRYHSRIISGPTIHEILIAFDLLITR